MLQEMPVDGMVQFVLINHVLLHQPLLNILLMLNAEPTSLVAQLLLQDKDVLLSLLVNPTLP